MGFEHPVGISEGELGPDLDTRGEGGYAILPPSVRSDGRAYRWENPDSFVIYECPPALLAKMPPPGKHKGKRERADVHQRCSTAHAL